MNETYSTRSIRELRLDFDFVKDLGNAFELSTKKGVSAIIYKESLEPKTRAKLISLSR